MALQHNLKSQLSALELDHARFESLTTLDGDAQDNFAAQLAQLQLHSPYTVACLKQYPQFLDRFCFSCANAISLTQPLPLATLANELKQQLLGADEMTTMSTLRRFKHLCMAHITWRDLCYAQSIEDSLTQVSAVADITIMQAYASAYDKFAQRYGKPQGQHGEQHLLILGMGKLGGGELNFSSDIDLIFTYPASGELTGGRKVIEHQVFFTKVAQTLIKYLDENTVDGQVWRVDMRLRPFGESGPLVLPFSAFEDYYHHQGRSWERYAMLKARCINSPPSIPAADYQELANILRPFAYRRYIDFSVIESLRDMKQRIVRENRRLQRTDNIKLGPGGIREIEFAVQCFQLIYGGRIRELQTPSLFSALQLIKQHQLLPHEDVMTLHQHYLFLREIEHRLQQYNNEQTQTLPEARDRRERLAAVMGFGDYSALRQHIWSACDAVHNVFIAVIHDEDDDESPQEGPWQDIWQVALSQAQITELLPQLHIDTCHQIIAFKQDCDKLHCGERGQAVLNMLMPLFIEHVSGIEHAQQANIMSSVMAIISAVATRTAYLELMLENQNVRQQIITLCGKSRWIVEQLCRFPVLLDELIHPQYLQRSEHNLSLWKQEYSTELQQTLLRIEPEDEETRLYSLRQFKLSQQLRIAAADVMGYLPTNQVSDKLTVLAEVLLAQVMREAYRNISQRYGHLPEHSMQDMGIAVLGYGKLGGIELGYSSDLDVVFLHNTPRDQYSDGNKSLSTQEYYSKLVQRIMHLSNTATLLGTLYEIDLRLRPSGNSGVLVSHIDTFTQYQLDEAWVWEHQALIRARVVSGNDSLKQAIERARTHIICLPRTQADLASEIVTMRQKMRDHLGQKDKGALADIEFMTQYWCLLHSATFPEIIQFSDNLRQLQALAKVGVISHEDAQFLCESYLTCRHDKHHRDLAKQEVLSSSALAHITQRVERIWQTTLVPSKAG